MRVGYPMSAAMAGILPGTRFELSNGVLVLRIPRDLAFLDGEHLRSRLDQLAGVAGIKQSAISFR
jgi:exopolyphosphatase/guanosine-5'-triphosphate,3'-diphosphate pyrophosphatase